MDTVKIKHREFQIVEAISDNSFILERKGKKYFGRKFTPRSIEGNELSYALLKIKNSGVKYPKLYYVDEKNGYAVSEYIIGEKMTEYLSKNDMSDELFEQLFKIAYIARLSHMTLNYEPDKWWLVNGELFYMYPLFISYDKSKDLAERYIRLWFNTKELANFMAKNGVFYDKSRIKDEYSTNKEIVLKVCKYYR